MPKQIISIAKITRPKLSGVSPRERLFKILDQGCTKPVTWVSAPAGFGKTTLVASYLDSRKLQCLWYQVDAGDEDLASFFYYMGMAAKEAAPRYKKALPLLTPEYLQGIPVFTRRYFEELFRRLKPPSVIIFDSYQEAPLRSAFHEMIVHALDVIPEGIRVIIMSRGEAPARLARIKANNQINLIGWDEIRFTFKESSQLLNSQGKKLTQAARQRLYEKTEGWAAGLVLMTAGATDIQIEKHEFNDLSAPGIFDYFASEIFHKTDPDTRHFLLATSFLPVVTVSLAEQLTGVKAAHDILEKLNHRNYFTQKHATGERSYQYHALFREFLLAQARNYFDAGEQLSLKQKAADLLCDSGRTEEAIDLLKENKAWERLSELVVAQAPRLVAEGRNKTVEGWLRSIPEPALSQMPWALYWLGTCCLPFDQIEARGHYEKAYSLFKETEDISGRYLTWAGIADSFIYLWEDFSRMKPWLLELEVLQQEYPRFPSAQVEARVCFGAFSMMYYMDSGNPMVERWRERVETLMHELPDPNFKCQAANKLALYYHWYGTMDDLRRIVNYIGGFRDHPATTPLSRILVRHSMAWYFALSGERDHVIALSEESLHIAEQSGVHMLDLYILAYQVYAHGCRRADITAMGSILDRMRACLISQRRVDAAHYHHLKAWHLSLDERYDEALMHCREAAVVAELSMVSPTALVYVITAQTLLLAGRADEAEASLDQAAAIIEQHRCVWASYESSFVRAALALHRGNEESTREVRRTLALARQLGQLSYTTPHPRILQAICAYALQEGIETDYAVAMIRRNGLQPPVNAPDAWPWPVRITTFGNFEVRKDDQTVLFAGKKKQLDLVKILVALGGSSIREEQVMDILWPDAEGDAGHSSFKMGLSRLRAMMGNDAILHDEGLYSLNTKIVQADVWDFERACDAATRLWTQNAESKDRISEAIQLTKRGLELYRGHFLPDDDSASWTVSMRERLRSKFLRLTISAGRYYEEKGKWKTAAGYYEKGLEADPLREAFYQRLMFCQQKLGLRTEAMMTYNRCCSELSALGIMPSSHVLQIYESMK